MQFLEVAKGLQNQQVNPFFVQRRNLLAEGFASLFQRNLAQRFNTHAQRAYGPGHQGVEALSSFAGQTSAVTVDLDQLVDTTVFRQTKRIGAKGVCLNDLRSGLQVILVNAADEVGRREVQFVVAAIDEDPFGIQQGTHGAVT